MRFSSLEIPAFGPFTDFRYSFGNVNLAGAGESGRSGNETDLHIFLGNNESGKSSLLRAISNLLYGIHHSTSENFRHDYAKLLLQAQLIHSSGHALSIQRRKTTSSKQLTDAEGAPVSQMQLDSFIGNLSKENFHSLFGLGAEELQQGNEMLLSTGGALADAVAAASSGSQHLSKAVASLYEQSEEIYKSRGKARLQRLKKNISDLTSEFRKAETRPHTWKVISDKLGKIDAEHTQIGLEQEKIDQDINRNSRMLQGLETASRMELLQKELDALQLPAELVPGFANSLIAQLGQWRMAEESRLVAETRVSTLSDELQQFEYRTEVLEAEAEIDQLGANLSLHRERSEQYMQLQQQLNIRESELSVKARNIDGQLSLEDIDSIRLSSAQQLNCLDAYEKYTRSMEDCQESSRQIRDTQKQLKELRHTVLQLQQSHEPAAVKDEQPTGLNVSEAELTSAIVAGLKNIGYAEELDADTVKLEKSASDIKRQIARLGLDGDTDNIGDVRTLALPQRNTLIEYEGNLDELTQRQSVLQSELNGLLSERDDQEDQIQRLHSQRDLPSRIDMEKTREQRDKFWQKIQATGEKLTEKDTRNLSDALLSADRMADSLIDNAELLAQTNQKSRYLQELQKRIDKLQQALADLDKQKQQIHEQWLKLWDGIKSAPEAPASMLEWYDDWGKACDSVSDHEQLEEDASMRIAIVSDAMKRLAGIPVVLAESGLTARTELVGNLHLKMLVDAASNVKKAMDELMGAEKNIAQLRQKNETRLDELQRSHQAGKKRLVAAGKQLIACFADIGLVVNTDDLESTAAEQANQDLSSQRLSPLSLSPVSAYTLLQQRSGLVTDYDQYMQDYKELEQLQQLLAEYNDRVLKVAQQVKLEVTKEDTELLCRQLIQLLTDQRGIRDKSVSFRETIKAEQESLQQTKSQLQQSLLQIAGELKTFKVDTPAALISIQGKIERSDTLLTEISALKSTLASIATNKDLDAFIKEVMGQDVDQLAANAEKLKSRREELRLTGSTLIEERTLLTEELKKIDRTYGDAADIRQQLEHALAQQREATLEFVKTRLAADMLKRALEEFRANNEGPLISDASHIFKRLTCESYERISLAYTVDEKPFIQGERADGEKLTVDGMSDGTRDQLYLAMRLAALKIRLQSNEPMPLIVDDLLITFDDERTEAALGVLADISRLTQVILFTHHRRVLEASNRLFGDKQVTVTELQNCA